MSKRVSFEYVLTSLLSWYGEKGDIQNNDLSVLKSLKLLFLVTAADIESNRLKHNNNEESFLINNTFNAFYALPLGHVESDIYGWITETKGNLDSYSINKVRLTFKNEVNVALLGDEKGAIDDAIEYLKTNYPHLIHKKAFELVELTHKWNSWKFFYNSDNKVSRIPSEIIIKEPKYFT